MSEFSNLSLLEGDQRFKADFLGQGMEYKIGSGP